ncbi:MAG TPA: hypothetical protein VF185_02050 [Patescibacteria group bacterium]
MLEINSCLAQNGLLTPDLVPYKHTPIFSLKIKADCKKRNCLPSIIEALDLSYSDHPVAKDLLFSLKNPQNYAFRAFIRSNKALRAVAESEVVKDNLNKFGIEVPLTEIYQGDVFMQIGGTDYLPDYLCPKCDCSLEAKKKKSYLVVYHNNGLEYNGHASAVKITDGESLKDKVLGAIEVIWS